eukprot:TRINITY_DN6476_c0_g1_i1.p1 TRINITY_DN6476_c0_g1~~TRINITY_DN6476_c0_g1_i1.p1  ORF type:complete len:213 (-),score=29.56 TRINITY_DN6476_c0_g1_i1:29-667(-)
MDYWKQINTLEGEVQLRVIEEYRAMQMPKVNWHGIIRCSNKDPSLIDPADFLMWRDPRCLMILGHWGAASPNLEHQKIANRWGLEYFCFGSTIDYDDLSYDDRDAARYYLDDVFASIATAILKNELPRNLPRSFFVELGKEHGVNFNTPFLREKSRMQLALEAEREAFDLCSPDGIHLYEEQIPSEDQEAEKKSRFGRLTSALKNLKERFQF